MEKSYEGSLAFLLSAIIIVALMPHLNMAIGLVMAVNATLAEAMALRIGWFKLDDNITIPLASAVTGMVLYLLFFPSGMAALMNCP